MDRSGEVLERRAAISSVYQHAAVLLTDTGMEIMHQCYVHEPEPEPGE